MPDIKAIIEYLDTYIEHNNIISLTPPEANELLEKVGILKNSSTRNGKPLRDLLRAGELPHAFQDNGKRSKWHIPSSNPHYKVHFQRT